MEALKSCLRSQLDITPRCIASTSCNDHVDTTFGDNRSFSRIRRVCHRLRVSEGSSNEHRLNSNSLRIVWLRTVHLHRVAHFGLGRTRKTRGPGRNSFPRASAPPTWTLSVPSGYRDDHRGTAGCKQRTNPQGLQVSVVPTVTYPMADTRREPYLGGASALAIRSL